LRRYNVDGADAIEQLEAHNRAFAACHECVEALGGAVNQYLWVGTDG
jgi:hypothetical protein